MTTIETTNLTEDQARELRREYQRKYYREHREQVRAAHQRYLLRKALEMKQSEVSDNA